VGFRAEKVVHRFSFTPASHKFVNANFRTRQSSARRAWVASATNAVDCCSALRLDPRWVWWQTYIPEQSLPDLTSNNHFVCFPPACGSFTRVVRTSVAQTCGRLEILLRFFQMFYEKTEAAFTSGSASFMLFAQNERLSSCKIQRNGAKQVCCRLILGRHQHHVLSSLKLRVPVEKRVLSHSFRVVAYNVWLRRRVNAEINKSEPSSVYLRL